MWRGMTCVQVELASPSAVSWLRVVAAVQQRRHGGYTVQLHSGLRIRNGSEYPLAVGWRAPSREPVVLRVPRSAGVPACPHVYAPRT